MTPAESRAAEALAAREAAIRAETADRARFPDPAAAARIAGTAPLLPAEQEAFDAIDTRAEDALLAGQAAAAGKRFAAQHRFASAETIAHLVADWCDAEAEARMRSRRAVAVRKTIAAEVRADFDAADRKAAAARNADAALAAFAARLAADPERIAAILEGTDR